MKIMAKFPTYEEMGKKIAEEALDGYRYEDKTLREWIDILAQTQWIPCTEKLPEPRINVLCSTNNMGCVIGYYEEHANIWFAHIWWHEDIEMIVNAWMPLPPCYKGE